MINNLFLSFEALWPKILPPDLKTFVHFFFAHPLHVKFANFWQKLNMLWIQWTTVCQKLGMILVFEKSTSQRFWLHFGGDCSFNCLDVIRVGMPQSHFEHEVATNSKLDHLLNGLQDYLRGWQNSLFLWQTNNLTVISVYKMNVF